MVKNNQRSSKTIINASSSHHSSLNSLIWFRNDLRIKDNPALLEAIKHVQVSQSLNFESRLYGLFIIPSLEWKHFREYGMSKVDYYLRTLGILRIDLEKIGIPLIIRWVDYDIPKNVNGHLDQYVDPFTLFDELKDTYYRKDDISGLNYKGTFDDVCQTFSIGAVFYNIEYDGMSLERDTIINDWMDTKGILHQSFHDQCVVPVGKVLTQLGTPYKIFSQFKKTWATYINEHGLGVIGDSGQIKQLEIIEAEKLGSIPTVQDIFTKKECNIWHSELNLERVRNAFPAGETIAIERLHDFIQNHIQSYNIDRNHYCQAEKEGEKSQPGESRLSASLAIGAITTRQCLQTAIQADEKLSKKFNIMDGDNGINCWINELCWRDFYRHILFLFPHVGRGVSFRPEYQSLPWRAWSFSSNVKKNADFENAESDLQKWKTGHTGVPIVDAAMRQLSTEGWLGNRLRMIVAIYLTKDLLIHWRRGESHFNRQLIDCDYPSNNGGWQWSASTGTDAQPYFRIFNPLLQSEKYDPEGNYIKTWVNELSPVKGSAVHAPHLRLGKNEFSGLGYPSPMVDHQKSKAKVLAMFTSTFSFTKNKRPHRAK